VDTDGDGVVSDAERVAYAASACADLARDTSVSVDGTRLRWSVTPGAFEYAPGAAGLDTSRLACRFGARADLGGASTVDVANSAYADRVGWREITAAGVDVHLVDPPVPAESVSGGLRAYPRNLLSSPLNVRSARLTVRPGSGAAAVAVRPAGAGWLTRWTAAADNALTSLVGGRLTPLVGVLAVLLALALGAAHAALPGHGKTMMAAYLAGRRGRPRDAVAVGATVTLTHTGGVLILGLLLTTSASLAGESVLKWLGVASGALVALVGAAMLVGVVRRRGLAGPPGHTHGPGGHSHGPHRHSHSFVEPARHHEHTDAPHHHDHPHHAGHGEHTDAPGHDHPGDPGDPGHHEHTHAPGERRNTRLGLLGMGIAGGLVPSPSAIVVLLGAIGLGRTGFGVLLVVAYGLGMAATLTAAGLLLVKMTDRWAARQDRRGWGRLAGRLAGAAPAGTATLVLLVGIGLAGRAVLG
jgi:ABC-type nickel/cobalt efflux system permease component RcnA